MNYLDDKYESISDGRDSSASINDHQHNYSCLAKPNVPLNFNNLDLIEGKLRSENTTPLRNN